MNREQFIAQLARLLQDLPPAERQEAIRYYQEYFDDAGEENEDAVIQELGSPGKVAASIKANLQQASRQTCSMADRHSERMIPIWKIQGQKVRRRTPMAGSRMGRQ